MKANKFPWYLISQQGENYHVGPNCHSHVHAASGKNLTKNHLANLFSDALCFLRLEMGRWRGLVSFTSG